jgi:hypothetical protein
MLPLKRRRRLWFTSPTLPMISARYDFSLQSRYRYPPTEEWLSVFSGSARNLHDWVTTSAKQTFDG